jgi:hypothetical protein
VANVDCNGPDRWGVGRRCRYWSRVAFGNPKLAGHPHPGARDPVDPRVPIAREPRSRRGRPAPRCRLRVPLPRFHQLLCHTYVTTQTNSAYGPLRPSPGRPRGDVGERHATALGDARSRGRLSPQPDGARGRGAERRLRQSAGLPRGGFGAPSGARDAAEDASSCPQGRARVFIAWQLGSESGLPQEIRDTFASLVPRNWEAVRNLVVALRLGERTKGSTDVAQRTQRRSCLSTLEALPLYHSARFLP